MEERLLLIPGPTNLSKRVRDVMALPQLPHVGSEFYSMFKETVSLARYVSRMKRGLSWCLQEQGRQAWSPQWSASSLTATGR